MIGLPSSATASQNGANQGVHLSSIVDPDLHGSGTSPKMKSQITKKKIISNFRPVNSGLSLLYRPVV